MDVLGFVCNIIDAANYILKSADTCMNITNASNDIRHQIEDVKNRAYIARQCGVAMQSWRENGEIIPIEYLGPAKNARKAYEEAMTYLQEKIRKCEEGNRAKKLFGKAQYAVKGKERAAFVARRVIDTTDTLKHMVEMRVHLADTSLAARFRPFLDRAWQHSIDEKIVKPMVNMNTARLGCRKLGFGDCIGVSGSEGDKLFADRVFVQRHPESKEEDTRLLASLLSADVEGIGQKFGLLQCVGYVIERVSYNSLETFQTLVFKRPNATRDPVTLRELLLREDARKHTICDRLNFARTLTTSLVIHHSMGIVHKSICPESIAVFNDMLEHDEDKRHYKLGTPYLLAFDHARSEKSESGKLHTGERNNRREFYIYPEHLRTQRVRAFETRDDVYGLGICLLEIGLWKSIFKVSKDAGSIYERPEFNDWANDLADTNEKKEGEKEETEHQRKWERVLGLIELARNELPKTMGMKYASAVIACLVMELPEEHRYRRSVDDWEVEVEMEGRGAMEGSTEESPEADSIPTGKTRHPVSTIESLQNVVRTFMMVPSLISSYRTKKRIEQATKELLEEQLVEDEESFHEKAESDDTLIAGSDASFGKPDKKEQPRKPTTSVAKDTPSSDVNHLSRKSRQNLAFATDVLKKLYSIRL